MTKYEHSAVLPPISAARAVFARQRQFAEHCVNQLDDAQFFAELYPGLNPVGVVMQHMAGNMLSRWTDFLTADGEKPWRTREEEFAKPTDESDPAETRQRIMEHWEKGWAMLFAALDDAEHADPDVTVTIRGVPHSVPMAIARQLDHYAFHVGQIATIARGHVGTENWKWFTVPPGGTAAFNASLGYKP